MLKKAYLLLFTFITISSFANTLFFTTAIVDQGCGVEQYRKKYNFGNGNFAQTVNRLDQYHQELVRFGSDLNQMQAQMTSEEYSQNQSRVTTAMQSYEDERELLIKQMYEVGSKIAQKIGAAALIDYGRNFQGQVYINPDCDVTQRVIDELNVTYKIPTFHTITLKFKKKEIPNKNNLSPDELLYEAIMNDSPEDVEYAVQKGASTQKDIYNMMPVSYAVRFKKFKVVQALVSRGARVSGDPELILNAFDNIETALFLVRSGADISKIKQIVERSVSCAVNSKNKLWFEFIQEFIRRGYDVNDVWFIDPSLSYKNDATSAWINFLLENGADKNHKKNMNKSNQNPHCYTPLYFAVMRQNPYAVNALLDAGADIHQAANGGYSKEMTPLQLAIEIRSESMVKLLRERGAVR